jgi:hypothetical protein
MDDSGDSVPVCVRLTPQQYDDVYQQAQQDRVSVPEVIRRQLDPTRRYPK